MLVILLSLIIGFGIANATNKKSLKFILTYSLSSFIIIVFILQKSCKKCKDNKECDIEKFDNVDSFKKNLIKLITELKFFTNFLKTNKNKISQEKINEICDKLKRSSKLSQLYLKNLSVKKFKQELKQKTKKVENIGKHVSDLFEKKAKKMSKDEFKKNQKKFLKKMKQIEKIQKKYVQNPLEKLNMVYINSVIKETTKNLNSYIASTGKKFCD